MSIIANRNNQLSIISGGKTDKDGNSTGTTRNVNYLSVLPLDVTIIETHVLQQKVTDKPVEGGARVADNIILLPEQVTMGGYMITDKQFSVNEKMDMLNQLRESREPFTVVTSLKVYEDMFFAGDIYIYRTKASLGALNFSVKLKRIILIENQSDKVPKEKVAKTENTTGGGGGGSNSSGSGSGRGRSNSGGGGSNSSGSGRSNSGGGGGGGFQPDISGQRVRMPAVELGKQSTIPESGGGGSINYLNNLKVK